MTTACTLSSQAADEPIIGSATVADRFVFISWPKRLWPTTGQLGPVVAPWMQAARRFDQVHGGKTTVRLVTSLTKPTEEKRVDIRCFPAGFMWEDVPTPDVPSLLENGLLTEPTTSSAGRVLTVCTHGKWDQCCAKYGQSVWKQLADSDLEASVLQASHLGGHRFAATLIDFQPGQPGRMYGRLTGDDIPLFVHHIRSNTVWLERYRGRVDLPFDHQIVESEALRSGVSPSASLTFTSLSEDTYRVDWERGHLDVRLAEHSYQGVRGCGNASETWIRRTCASVSSAQA